MVVDGGEVAFVTRMIDESLRLRERVGWYTSMLGKLSSVSVIIERLIDAGNRNYAVTEFVQGTKTRRWAVAWSWRDFRPAMVNPLPRDFSNDKTRANIEAECGQRYHWFSKASAAFPVRVHISAIGGFARHRRSAGRRRASCLADTMALARQFGHWSRLCREERLVPPGASQRSDHVTKFTRRRE